MHDLVQVKRYFSGYAGRVTRRGLLKSIGLPWKTRWQEAEPVLIALIVQARRGNDEETAKQLSWLKATLKRILKRSCNLCGAAVDPHSVQCSVCRRSRNDK